MKWDENGKITYFRSRMKKGPITPPKDEQARNDSVSGDPGSGLLATVTVELTNYPDEEPFDTSFLYAGAVIVWADGDIVDPADYDVSNVQVLVTSNGDGTTDYEITFDLTIYPLVGVTDYVDACFHTISFPEGEPEYDFSVVHAFVWSGE